MHSEKDRENSEKKGNELSQRPGLIGKSPMEVSDMLRSVNVSGSDPIILFVGVFVAKPFHIVPELFRRILKSPVELGIHYLFDFIVRFAVDDLDSRRRWLFALRERIRDMWFELRDVEDRVNAF